MSLLPIQESKQFQSFFTLTKRTILKNASWMMIDKVMRMGLNIIIYPLLTRYLAPEQFGNLSYCLAVVLIAQTIIFATQDQIAIRELVSNPEAKHHLLGSVFIIKCLIAVFGFWGVIIIANSLHSGEAQIKYGLYILSSILFFQSIDVIRVWFESQKKFQFYALSSSISFLICFVLKLLCIYWNLSFMYVIFAFALEYFFIALFLIIFYLNASESFFLWKFSMTHVKKIFVELLPYLLAVLFSIMHMKIDQMLLKNLQGAQALGIYASAIKISEVFFVMLSIIVATIYPYVVEIQKSDLKGYSNRIDRMLQLLFILSAGFAVLISFFAKSIISFLYGDLYIDGANILMIHVWSGIFVTMAITNNSWLVTQKLTRFTLAFSLIGLVINVVVNLILIPKLGGIGAAISLLISNFVSAYVILFIFPQTRDLFIRQTKSILLMNIKKFVP